MHSAHWCTNGVVASRDFEYALEYARKKKQLHTKCRLDSRDEDSGGLSRLFDVTWSTFPNKNETHVHGPTAHGCEVYGLHVLRQQNENKCRLA